VLRARFSERVPVGVVYTTFHHPVSGANVVTTEHSDWATNCPEYKVTAVQVRAKVAVRAETVSDGHRGDRLAGNGAAHNGDGNGAGPAERGASPLASPSAS